MRNYLPLYLTLLFLGCGPATNTPADAGQEPVDAGPPPCDPAKCAANNICVQNKCMLQCKRHTECPGGYDCRDVEGQLVCVSNNQTFGKNYFGYSCGINGDRDCKTAEGFVCQGPQGDPESYCTKVNCTADTDCPGNYYCADQDTADGKTRKVCLKRDFCAPAASLADCNEADAVFVKDSKGRGFCLRPCNPNATNNPCGRHNQCLKFGAGGVCWPKVGPDGVRTCAPTKTYCSRCTSRADCPAGGLCMLNDFTKERYCTMPCNSGMVTCPKSHDDVTSSCYDYPKDTGGHCHPNPNLTDMSDEQGFSCYFIR